MEGTTMTTYRDTEEVPRVPMWALLAAAPLLGLAFVIFLPLIGFVMVGRLTADSARRALATAIAAMRTKTHNGPAR